MPVTQLDLVSKYIGPGDNANVKVNRLGGGEWKKTKAKVRESVKDMAKELIALYAKRMSTKGYAFPKIQIFSVILNCALPMMKRTTSLDAQRR